MSKFVKLSSIAELTVGFVGTMAKHYEDEGIPFLRSLNIKPFKIISDDMKYVSAEFSNSLSKSILHKGDVVIVRNGIPGTCCVVPAEYDGCNCSDVVIVHPNTELVNPHYLAAYINFWGQRQIQNNKVGAIQQHFNVHSAEEMLIFLPDITEQEKIAKTIVALNGKIENNFSVCVELEAMAKTLYDYWFTQFDFPNAEGKPYRSSGGEMVWNDQLKREIPKGWTPGTISSLMKIENTSVNPQKLGNALMEHYSIPAFDANHNPAYEEAGTIESGKYVVDPECILTSKLNPHFKRLWDPYCDTENAICSTEFIVYRPRTAWTRPFCYAVLNSEAFYAHMVGKATASTGSRKRIQPDVSASFELAIPDEKTMRAFVELYAPIMEKQKALYKENCELTKLRDWLLPVLMNGQATVA